MDEFKLYNFLRDSVNRWHHEDDPLLDDRFEDELQNTIFELRRQLKIQIHHTIPVSMLGANTPENKLELPVGLHTDLHKVQNVSSNLIRKFRLRTNNILLTWEYFNLYYDLLLMFFENAHKSWSEDLQKKGIKEQWLKIESNRWEDILKAYIDKLVIEQKKRIMNVYNWKEKF